MATHRYLIHCSWRGSTGEGYEHFLRRHEAAAPPANIRLSLSADPAFYGEPTELNPEQLVVLAASSCQLLSFLAVAARSRIDVREYIDEAEGIMPEDDLPVRLTQIVLRPRIVIASEVPEGRVRHLVKLAHKQCYITNSLRTDVVVNPEIKVQL